MQGTRQGRDVKAYVAIVLWCGLAYSSTIERTPVTLLLFTTNAELKEWNCSFLTGALCSSDLASRAVQCDAAGDVKTAIPLYIELLELLGRYYKLEPNEPVRRALLTKVGLCMLGLGHTDALVEQQTISSLH